MPGGLRRLSSPIRNIRNKEFYVLTRGTIKSASGVILLLPEVMLRGKNEEACVIC